MSSYFIVAYWKLDPTSKKKKVQLKIDSFNETLLILFIFNEKLHFYPFWYYSLHIYLSFFIKTNVFELFVSFPFKIFIRFSSLQDMIVAECE